MPLDFLTHLKYRPTSPFVNMTGPFDIYALNEDESDFDKLVTPDNVDGCVRTISKLSAMS